MRCLRASFQSRAGRGPGWFDGCLGLIASAEARGGSLPTMRLIDTKGTIVFGSAYFGSACHVCCAHRLSPLPLRVCQLVRGPMLTFLLAAAISYTLTDTSVLQPPKAPAMAVWTSEPATREAVEFTAKDGSHVRGWIYRAKQGNDGGTLATHPFVLFFYGSNEDLVHEHTARLAWLRDTLHVNAVCFDFPGYGFSTGKVSVKATREIALEEYDFVHDHLAAQGSRGDGSLPAVVTYGWSIGTGLAVHVASRRTVAGLILQAPPASADEMAAWSSKHDVPRFARGVVNVTVDAEVQQSTTTCRRSRVFQLRCWWCKVLRTMWCQSHRGGRCSWPHRQSRKHSLKFQGHTIAICGSDIHQQGMR